MRKVEVIYSKICIDEQGVLSYKKAYRVGARYTTLEEGDELINVKTDEELRAEFLAKKEIDDSLRLAKKAQQAKQLALDSITVEVGGLVFHARDKDQARMVAALKASEVLGVTTIGWKIADNSVVEVDKDTLTMALTLGIQEVGRIVKGQ